MTTQTRPTQDVAAPPVRSAWTAIALTPLSYVTGLVVTLGLAAALGLDLFPVTGTLQMPVWKYLLAVVPGDLIAVTAPSVGLVLGLRAARSGNRRGLAAAIVAAVVLLALAALFVNDAVSSDFA